MKKIIMLLGVCFYTLLASPISLEHDIDSNVDLVLYTINKTNALDKNTESYSAYMLNLYIKTLEEKKYRANGKRNYEERDLLNAELNKLFATLKNEFEAEEEINRIKKIMTEKMESAEKNIKNKEFFTVRQATRGKYDFSGNFFPFPTFKYGYKNTFYFDRLNGLYFETYLNLIDDNDKNSFYDFFKYPMEKIEAKTYVEENKDVKDYMLRTVYKIVDTSLVVPWDSSNEESFIKYNTTKAKIEFDSASGNLKGINASGVKSYTNIKLIRIELIQTKSFGSAEGNYNDKDIKILYTLNLE